MVHESTSSTGPDRTPSTRAAGIVLIAAALIMVGFFAAHPSHRSHDMPGFIAEATAALVQNGIVHGVLMAIMAAMVVGYLSLSERLGVKSVLVRAGMVSYSVGTIAMIAAALVNGFLVPRLASRYSIAEPTVMEGLRPFLVFCHETNRVCDNIGVMGMSVGVLLWSLMLLRRPGTLRLIGAVGVVFGAGPPILLLAGMLPMDFHGMGAFILTQAIWSAVVGVQLMRNRI